MKHPGPPASVPRAGRRLRIGTWLALGALGSTVGALPVAPCPAFAQSPPPAAPVIETPRTDAEVQRLVARLRIPVLRRYPERIRAGVERLLDSPVPSARVAVAQMIRDRTRPVDVARHVVDAVLARPPQAELTAALLERAGSADDGELGARIRGALTTTARRDAGLRELLAAAAADRARSAAVRVAAVEALGSSPDATIAGTSVVELLVRLWADRSSSAVSAAAEAAYRRAVPGGDDVPAAQRVVARLRGGESLADVLRARLLSGATVISPAPPAPPAPAPPTDLERRYRGLAEAAVDDVGVDELVSLYVRDCPFTDLRATAARRLAEIDYAAEADPEAARELAVGALTDLLSRPPAELQIAALDCLGQAFVADLRRASRDGPPQAATALAAGLQGRPTKLRLAAIRLLRVLADPRSAGFLRAQFDAAPDAEREVRIGLLDALAAVAEADVGESGHSEWVAERVPHENDPKVAVRLLQELAKGGDVPVGPFADVLRVRRDEAHASLRAVATAALSRLWVNRSLVPARSALVEWGLTDPSAAVRQRSAKALQDGAALGLETSLPALERAAREDGSPDVRLAAARALIALAPSRCLELLGGLIADEAVFQAYVEERSLALEGGESVDLVLDDARALRATEDDRAARAVPLLRHVVAMREQPWRSSSGRGAPRELLARWLLADGEATEATRVADELVAAADEGDPRYRWRLLALRARRADDGADDVGRLVAGLAPLAALPGRGGPGEVPAGVVAAARLELGDVFLELDDPVAATGALALIGEPPPESFSEANRARFVRLLADSRRRADEERRRVRALIVAAGGPDEAEAERAAGELTTLGHRAARHVAEALGTDDLPPPELTVLLRLSSRLTGQEFALDEGAPASRRDEVLGAVRAALRALVDRALGLTPQ